MQTAPPAWAALRATLQLPVTVHSDERVEYRVALRNDSERPVTLTPCPHYSFMVAGAVEASALGVAGYTVTSGEGGTLPCGRVLAPGDSLQLPLVLDTVDRPLARGVVRVEWAIAGVPVAKGQFHIR